MIKVYEEVNCLEDQSMIAGSQKTIGIACFYPDGTPVPLGRFGGGVGCFFAPYGSESGGLYFQGTVTIGDDENGNIGNTMMIAVPADNTLAYQNCTLVYMPYITDGGLRFTLGKGKLFVASTIA